jgi:hypothetical protein
LRFCAAAQKRKYAPSIVMWSHGKKGSKSLGGRHWGDPTNCT